MTRKIIALLSVLLLCIAICGCKAKNLDAVSSKDDTGIAGNLFGNGQESSSGSVSINTADTSNMDFTFTDRDKEGNYDGTNVTSVVLSDNTNTKITKAGTYFFSGTLKNKPIIIEAGENDKVQIVLSGVNIQNNSGPAIFVKSADKVFITLKQATQNTISDGSSYNFAQDEAADGAIFSRADLTINGSGSLNINGSYKHAIVSKDDLTISGGKLTVNAQNVGINGKDCVKISSADITINAGSDGIRSDNAEDADRGYVYIESGNINITSANDGIQAETAVKLENPSITIMAGGGSLSYLSSSDESFKGIKAVSDIIVSGGTYTIDSLDDCIHSNNTIAISGGTFKLSSGDDGVHADNDLAISNGKINITKSYEGLESTRIVITGGTHDITASDDGLNAAGGNDGSAMGRPGMGGFASSNGEINISGGYTLVDASGDGIDANGKISVSGGITLVSGPTNSGNGSFDYDSSATVTGGVLVALGSNGMAQGFSSAENQGAILTSISSQAANTSFALCDESGKVIVSFTPRKAYSSAVVTSSRVQSGNTYSIVVGGTVSGADKNGYAENASISGGSTIATIQMTSSLYSVGGGMGGGMGGGRPGGNMGGGPGGRPGGFYW